MFRCVIGALRTRVRDSCSSDHEHEQRSRIPRQVLNRLHNFLVTTTAAKVPRQVIPDLLLRGMWNFVEQGLGRKNKAGSAVAALQRAEFHEGFLKRMQRILTAQSFDGQNLAAVRIYCQHRARTHRLAIEQQRARSTNLNIAAQLGAGQIELLAHQLKQGYPRLDLDALFDAVNMDGNCFLHR